MSTYCTIQEAYNEPSFSKQKKPTPGKLQCGQNSQSGQIGLSNIPYANNAYNTQMSQEQAAYRSSMNNAQPAQSVQQKYMTSQKGTSPYVANTPGSQAAINSSGTPNTQNTPNMVEEFMCGGSAAVIPTNSSGKMSRQIDPAIGNMPYAAQANDYKYYCDNMGICPSAKISIEGFTNNYGSESYLEPPSYNTPKQKELQAIQHELQYQDGLPQNVQVPQSQPSNCQMSEQSTTYQYPISDLTKKQYDAAMKVYLNNGQCGTPQKKSPYSMNNISGLYDEEIGQYMRVQDTNISYPIPPSKTYDNAYLMSQQVPRNVNNFTPQPSDDYHSLSSTSEQIACNNQSNINNQSNTPGYSPSNYTPNTKTPPGYTQNNYTPNTKTPPGYTPNNYISNTDLTNLHQYLASINQYLANLNQYLPGSNLFCLA